MAKMRLFSRKTKRILGIVLAVVLIGVVIALCVKVEKNTTSKSLVLTDYSIGTILPNGKIDTEKNEHLVSNYVTVDGLKVDIKNNPDVSYQVFFYDGSYTLLSSNGSTNILTEDYTYTNVTGAKYARIQITPIGDQNGKISFYEVPSYANQLTVTFNK